MIARAEPEATPQSGLGYVRLVVMLAVCLVLFCPRSAIAEDMSGLGAVFLELVIGLPLGITDVVYTAGNLAFVVNGEQSTPGWRYGGYVFGGLNMAVGTLWLVNMERGHKQTVIEVGSSHMVLGAICIGFTIWASCLKSPKEKYLEWIDEQKQRPGTSISVMPIVMPDPEGRPALGVGLHLANW